MIMTTPRKKNKDPVREERITFAICRIEYEQRIDGQVEKRRIFPEENQPALMISESEMTDEMRDVFQSKVEEREAILEDVRRKQRGE